MTKEEIIELTRKAGGFDATPEFLERFATLVAAHEREACAKVCEKDDSMRWSGAADAIRARSEQ